MVCGWTAARLARAARASRRSKSDIARDAINKYLDRLVPQDEIDRQLALMAVADAGDARWMEEMAELHEEVVADIPASGERA